MPPPLSQGITLFTKFKSGQLGTGAVVKVSGFSRGLILSRIDGPSFATFDPLVGLELRILRAVSLLWLVSKLSFARLSAVKR